jgi:hypothetical protein
MSIEQSGYVPQVWQDTDRLRSIYVHLQVDTFKLILNDEDNSQRENATAILIL